MSHIFAYNGKEGDFILGLSVLLSTKSPSLSVIFLWVNISFAVVTLALLDSGPMVT